MLRPIITLTTDFGHGSAYVAQMKGVLLSALPQARLIDITHDLPPQSIKHTEVLLRSTAFAFPLGTVHLVVVDPGVGTARRGIAVETDSLRFVGPDNGVLGSLATRPDARVVELNRSEFFREPVAPTFHGRDIFAPVAAELAGGLALSDVGTLIPDPKSSNLPKYRVDGSTIHGEILAQDRFGNLLTNLPGNQISRDTPPTIGEYHTQWVRTYGEGAEGSLLALLGSDGYLEIAVRNDSAANYLGRDVVGTEVIASTVG